MSGPVARRPTDRTLVSPWLKRGERWYSDPLGEAGGRQGAERRRKAMVRMWLTFDGAG